MAIVQGLLFAGKCRSCFQLQSPPVVCAAVESSSSSSVDLSVKERRRQRNERRLELASSRRSVKKEIEENFEKSAIRKKKSDHSLAKLANLGMKWYVLRVFSNNEAASVEALQSTLEAEFPTAQFEVWCPIIPKESVSRGKTRLLMKAVQLGHVYVRCVLEPAVYRHILKEQSVFSFVGSVPYKMTEGYNTKMMRGGYCDVYLPSPVPDYQIDALREEVRKKEEEFKESQRKKRVEATGQELVTEEERETKDLAPPREMIVGDLADITSGPYQNFRGTISEFLPAGQVKVIVPVFGTDTEIEVKLQDLSLCI